MKTIIIYHRKKRGFTLVEVLVVIAIVIALAAITATFYGKAQRAAKSASTVSRLREIGVAAGSWTVDNNQFFPPCWDNTEGANKSYAQTLDPYMHGLDNFRSKESKFIGPNARKPVEVNQYSHPITFSTNKAVCRDITETGGVAETLVHVSQVQRIDDVILMADGCQNPSNLNQANASAYSVFGAVGATGPIRSYTRPIPIGPDVDEASGDGWFRYPDDRCHALMCSGGVRVFKKGEIKTGNVWIDQG